MEEAAELGSYLPRSYKSQGEHDYMAFLWDAFATNYGAGKYEFASLAFHLMYMSFVSFSIWQIRLVRETEFRYALVGFQADTENELLTTDSPFKFYGRLKESQIFRFLKVIGCVNEQVGEFAKFVRRRNRIAHPSGTVFFNDQRAIDDEIAEIMREVANIQEHMRPVITDVYRNFLQASANPEEREYGTPSEEIEANLLHRSYISQKDIEVCLAFDITSLQAVAGYPEIEALHQSLREGYAAEVAAA